MMKRRPITTVLLLAALVVLVCEVCAAEKFNVLFIAVDDLRPELGCYGQPMAKTPNIDRLAERGLRFDRAYCQVSQCNQSRASLMTGLRPDTTKVYDIKTHFRENLPDVITLPQHFKQNGYYTISLGKIYHRDVGNSTCWSESPWFPPGSAPGSGIAYGPEGKAILKRARAERRTRSSKKGLPWEAPDVADNELPDGATADRAIKILSELKERPFFLAVGFSKPHLPFVAPKRYWDLYSSSDVRLTDHPQPPRNAPKFAYRSHPELGGYLDVPRPFERLTTEQRRDLVHGYLAATSYADAQVGRVLQSLDELGLADSTVVVLWGDHGFHLGDQGMWGKTSNYEIATRVPLLIVVPGQKTKGASTGALVELVDVYPSLAEVCGLAVPEELEGTSFKPLLTDPGRPWKKGALSQYLRPRGKEGELMGRALRTDRYRLVEWRSRDNELVDSELYDYRTDPGETGNLARQPIHAAELNELSMLLNQGWKALQPSR